MSISDFSSQWTPPPWFEHLHSLSNPSKKNQYMHRLHAWYDKNCLPMYTYTPDVDLRETASDFFLELELPGVSDKASIKIHWASSRLLVIEGEIARPRVQSASTTAANAGTQNERLENGEKGSVHSHSQQRHHEPSLYPEFDGVRLTICERKIGHYVRNFTFPVDVDRNGLKARLDAGLLEIQIPKWQQSEDKWKVEIE